MPPAEDAQHAAAPVSGTLDEAGADVTRRAHTPFDRFVLRASAWFSRHTAVRLIVTMTIIALALAQTIALLVFGSEISERLEGFGYLSVFVTNLLSTATFFIPVPGLTAAAQAIIITEGANARFPWLIGVAGGLGMALGEITAYYAGYLGAEMVRGRELPGPKRFHATIARVQRGIHWLIDNWGMLTLFVLSAVPNPFFEFAGLTAGSVRMPFRRFLIAVTAGKIVRGILLAYIGDAIVGDELFERLPFV